MYGAGQSSLARQLYLQHSNLDVVGADAVKVILGF